MAAGYADSYVQPPSLAHPSIARLPPLFLFPSPTHFPPPLSLPFYPSLVMSVFPHFLGLCSALEPHLLQLGSVKSLSTIDEARPVVLIAVIDTRHTEVGACSSQLITNDS
eukprot:2080058-Pleurochrysis_carterae.AAC.3